MSRLLAIDPGPEQSAWCIYDTRLKKPVDWAKDENDVVLSLIEGGGIGTSSLYCKGVSRDNGFRSCDECAIEMVASYGMGVGASVFETCVWIGRFDQQWMLSGLAGGERAKMVFRRDVKLHVCGQPRAKDSNIRQALIDRWGGKEVAIGRKASPGVLYGVKADVWSALAVAVTFADSGAWI